MNQFSTITNLLVSFREDRNWAQFHNPKDLAMGISIEASELLEVFLWKKWEEAEPDKIKEELADVFAYCFMLAHHYGFDIETIIREKVETNGLKYPVEKARGRSDKYDKL